MKLKFLVPIALIMLGAVTANGQKASFGLRAGVNFQNLNGKDFEGEKLENKMKTGFNVGLNAEIPVAPDYFLQPGVLFTTKGAKHEGDGSTNISYIEIPVNFVYKPVVGAGRMILGFGPYVGFGIGGKVKDGDDEADIKFKSTISPTEWATGTYYKAFDAGANILFGYEFTSKISAQLNAQLGLVNINPKVEGFSDDETKVKNTGFGVSLGYRF
jgi:hypothetical protein